MIRFAFFTDSEFLVVRAIAERSVELGIHKKVLDAEMDIAATAYFVPLRLTELRDADDFNFIHDLGGIRGHLNRETGLLENFFLPRFAAHQNT